MASGDFSNVAGGLILSLVFYYFSSIIGLIGDVESDECGVFLPFLKRDDTSFLSVQFY